MKPAIRLLPGVVRPVDLKLSTPRYYGERVPVGIVRVLQTNVLL